MHEKNSYCSFCGTRFPASEQWPRRCRICSNSTYLNPLPVVVVLVPVADGLVVVRRNIEPQKGTLTLPGGYIDVGETWQDAGKRELLEETGIDIDSGEFKLFDVMNGLDDTLVIFGFAEKSTLNCLKPFSSDETQEVALIKKTTELGFAMHTLVVARYFAQRDAETGD